MLNAYTDGQVRRQPKNSVKRMAVRVQTGGERAGRRQQIECTQLQLSGGAQTEGSGVVVGAPADPMEFRPSVPDVRAQGVAKGQTNEAQGDDRDLASEFLARESGSAETGSSVVVVPTLTDPAGIRTSARGLRTWSAAKKAHR